VHLTVAADKSPKGDGTLMWEINPRKRSIRVWWNGALIGQTTSKMGFTADSWTNGRPGSIGEVSGDTVKGIDDSKFGGRINSPLRYYKGQTI